jgi:uncharacterized membrane protein YcaP (DUF421 family)
VFFMGGLTLTAMVGKEVSFTNALLQIIAIAVGHYLIAWGRFKSSRFARLTDGTPLVLLERGRWRSESMKHMGIQQTDIMASARANNIASLDQIETAVLERNGDISVLQYRQKPEEA